MSRWALRPDTCISPIRRGWGFIALFLCLLFHTGTAAVWAQADGTQRPLVRDVVLGEVLGMDLLAQETATFAFTVTEVGRYRLMSGLLPTQDIHVTLTSSANNRLFANAFTDVDLTLLPDTYTLTFAAVEDATFDFVLVRHFGSFSVNPEVVRVIHPGHHLALRETEQSELFARIMVPRQVQAQEWLVVLDHDATTPLTLHLEGADLDLETEIQGSETLSFWSAGGEYLLRLDAIEGGVAPALTFMHPGEEELAPLYLNSTVDGAMSLNRSHMRFHLTVDDGFITTLELTSAYAGDLDLEIRSLTRPDAFTVYSASPFAQESISGLLLVPDTYLVTVERVTGQGDALFSLSLNVNPVPTYTVTPEEPRVAFQGEDDLLDLHGFTVAEAGRHVSLALKPAEVTTEPAFVFGRQVQTWRTVNTEQIEFIAPDAGPYFVGIRTLYGLGYYTLQLATREAPSRLPATGVTAGTIAAGDKQDHWLQIPAQSHLVSIILVSLGNQDLDLETNRYDPARHILEFKTSSSDPQVEAVAWYDPEPGYMLVSVLSFGVQSAEYLLVTHTQPLDE